MFHYGDVYLLVPLRLVGTNVDLKNGLQFLVSLLYHAYRLCVFDGCVLNADSNLLNRSFSLLRQ